MSTLRSAEPFTQFTSPIVPFDFSRIDKRRAQLLFRLRARIEHYLHLCKTNGRETTGREVFIALGHTDGVFFPSLPPNGLISKRIQTVNQWAEREERELEACTPF